MRIGVPTEIKPLESRVGLTPESVAALVAAGHELRIQSGAGMGSGFTDDEYRSAGGRLEPSARAVFEGSELIVKVKEPQLSECALLTPQHVIFCYLHLVAVPEVARALCDSGCTAIAYETVTSPEGGLPLLRPMSAIAGRLSIQVGAAALQKSQGGSGILMAAGAGMPAVRVLVIGAGVAGSNAAQVAHAMGAEVTIVDRSSASREKVRHKFGNAVTTAAPDAIAELVRDADLVIGAALIPGAAAPKVISLSMLKTMRPGSVLVDVSIDQGGCFETSRPTTLAESTFVVDGIVHYCVTNMPGDVPRTSTVALNRATLPYVQAIAGSGWVQACETDPHLARGVNVSEGRICNEAVAAALAQ